MHSSQITSQTTSMFLMKSKEMKSLPSWRSTTVCSRRRPRMPASWMNSRMSLQNLRWRSGDWKLIHRLAYNIRSCSGNKREMHRSRCILKLRHLTKIRLFSHDSLKSASCRATLLLVIYQRTKSWRRFKNPWRITCCENQEEMSKTLRSTTRRQVP